MADVTTVRLTGSDSRLILTRWRRGAYSEVRCPKIGLWQGEGIDAAISRRLRIGETILRSAVKGCVDFTWQGRFCVAAATIVAGRQSDVDDLFCSPCRVTGACLVQI